MFIVLEKIIDVKADNWTLGEGVQVSFKGLYPSEKEANDAIDNFEKKSIKTVILGGELSREFFVIDSKKGEDVVFEEILGPWG